MTDPKPKILKPGDLVPRKGVRTRPHKFPSALGEATLFATIKNNEWWWQVRYENTDIIDGIDLGIGMKDKDGETISKDEAIGVAKEYAIEVVQEHDRRQN